MKNDGERIASMEVEVKNLSEKVNSVENSVHELHGKFDVFQNTIIKSMVSNEAFTEYKKSEEIRRKNGRLEKLIYILVTAIVAGLVAFFFREMGV
jgi:predicted nuclease with TOPRIM domain